MVAESHQKCCYESCPERMAAEAHQNIAVKAVQRNCCQISPKFCYKSCPVRSAAEAHQNIAVKAVQRKLKIGAEAHQNIAARANQKKMLSSLTKNIDTRAA